MGTRRKIGIAYNLLKDEGVLEVSIRTLQLIKKHTRKSHHQHLLDTGAYYTDILSSDLSKPANIGWQPPSPKKKELTFNWLMPPPGKGSGGHMTIFRFINYLEQAGHKCRIYFYCPGPGSSVEAVKAVMGDSFPKVRASMQWLEKGEQMSPADGIFATSWQTAYSVYCSTLPAKKFYFVQDFEPYFYPVGSFYTLAENTYMLGLRGITAGKWLEKKLSSEYGMKTSAFSFGSDANIYSLRNKRKRREVVFYARPTTARRAFEVGILALDLFHKMHPDFRINFIGWDVSEFSIPFPHNNLGILDPSELNRLYNRCAASLVMSLTNMSLLPLELLGSGCIPVVNDGENNRLVTDNKYIAYSNNDPLSLAKRLSEIVSMKDLPSYADEAARSVSSASWDDSGRSFVSIVETSVRSKGEA